jgi:hypothetical protein
MIPERGWQMSATYRDEIAAGAVVDYLRRNRDGARRPANARDADSRGYFEIGRRGEGERSLVDSHGTCLSLLLYG